MHYPEFVRTNHRYRGPMESRKKNNSIRDIFASIELLRTKFNKLSTTTEKMEQNVYKNDKEEDAALFMHQIKSIKGGDI